MKKLQCPEIKKGENVHKHISCTCCQGKLHITPTRYLQWELGGLLVLEGGRDASDDTIFYRMEQCIHHFLKTHSLNKGVSYEKVRCNEPITTLRMSLTTIKFS